MDLLYLFRIFFLFLVSFPFIFCSLEFCFLMLLLFVIWKTFSIFFLFQLQEFHQDHKIKILLQNFLLLPLPYQNLNLRDFFYWLENFKFNKKKLRPRDFCGYYYLVLPLYIFLSNSSSYIF